MRQFGVELELSRRLVNVNYHERNHNAAWGELESILAEARRKGRISPDWKMKTDTSCGGEIVSPILFGPQGLAEVAIVCDIVNKLAKKYGQPAADGECGLHIHFDAKGLKPQNLSNIFSLLYIAEPIIFSMYPNRNFNYCAPMDINVRQASRARDWIDVRDIWYRGSNNVKKKDIVYPANFINGTTPGDPYDGTRYHGLNIHCYWKIGTIEFRYAPGSFDANFIHAYYDMCLGMVQTGMAAAKGEIKIPSDILDADFNSRKHFYAHGYRFRKHIKDMARRCGWSRETVSNITKLIRKNNPTLLNKDPSTVPYFVTNKNVHKVKFVIGGAYWCEHEGKLVKLDTNNSAHIRNYERSVDCKFDNGVLVSTSRNVHLCITLKMPKATIKRGQRIASMKSRDGSYYAVNAGQTIMNQYDGPILIEQPVAMPAVANFNQQVFGQAAVAPANQPAFADNEAILAEVNDMVVADEQF
jgi:hypothetical protein